MSVGLLRRRAWILLGVTLAGVLVGCARGPADPRLLCDGSEGPRFQAQYGGSGQVLPGSQVLSENGHDFLVIDGQCHFWVQQEAFGDVRTGTLGDAEAARLVGDLRLEEWQGIAGRYQNSLCDGPWGLYRFDSYRVSVLPTCNGADSTKRVEWVRQAVRSAIESLHAAGTPAEGPVRYVLVSDPGEEFPPGSEAYRNAPLWPLETAAASLAISPMAANEYSAGQSRLSSGMDATRLRAIAVSYRGGEIGRTYYGFIPIKDGEGRSYRFFVRDAIPLENDQGLWRAD